jgi:hypothetical protein
MVRHWRFLRRVCRIFLSFGFVHYIGCPPVFEANRDGWHGLSAARPIKAFRREWLSWPWLDGDAWMLRRMPVAVARIIGLGFHERESACGIHTGVRVLALVTDFLERQDIASDDGEEQSLAFLRR